MEYDVFLNNARKSLSGISHASFSKFITDSEIANSNLNAFLMDFDVSLKGDGIWKDDVQNEYTSIIASCKQSVESIEPFPQLISDATIQLDIYVEQIDKYIKSVDTYNTKKSAMDNYFQSKPYKGSYSDEEQYNQAYNSWYNGIESHKKDCNDALSDVQELQDECYILFNKINALLGSNDTSSSPDVSTNVSLIPVVINQTLPDGSTKIITEYYDEDGNKVESEYKIVNRENDVVEKAKVVFRQDGSVKDVVMDKKYEDGTIIKGDHFEYDKDGNMTNCEIEKIIYPNGDTESVVKIEYDEDGNIVNKVVGKTTLSDPIMQASVERLEKIGCTNIQLVRGDDHQKYLHEYAINSKGKDDYYYWKTIYKEDPQTGWEIYDKTEWVTTTDAEKGGIVTHDCDILTFEKDVNGASFNYISVYDKEKSAEYHEKFDARTTLLIEDLNTIPKEMVNEIMTKNKTYIKFSETPEVTDASTITVSKDGTIKLQYNCGGCSGLTESGNNLVQSNYDENLSDDYYSGLLLHELGHAYDSYSVVDGSNWMELTKNEVNSFLKTYDPNHPLFDWDKLTEEEKKSLVVENFANNFREFCRSPEKLKESCPESYNAMNNLYHKSAKEYGDLRVRASASP